MKLPSRVFSRRTRSAAETKPEGPQRHRSLAVEYTLERVRAGEGKVEVLDLGSACGETLAYYSDLPCKIYFADFYSDLKSRPPDPEDGLDGFLEACRRCLPFGPESRFDLVHSWDLFNYLELEQIGGLSRFLAPHLAPEAPLVSLIWIRQRIPAQPCRFAILDDHTVEYRPSSPAETTAPRYKEPDLLRAMGSYRARKSFLLRHGVQEYVFDLTGG
ncbi:MAG: hypothetical protein R3244_00570 [Thermoanaerobaculia bacterium]|nr:hypothetical protein [Thermoanaerobaculia bacterium]